MVLVPLVEIVLRATAGIGISGATAVVQHLTLFVGMGGAAIAARQNRLLSLSTTEFLKGRWRQAAEIFAAGVSAAIATFLAIASVQSLLVEREAESILVYGIPTWIVQLVFPIGFGLIAVRILRHSSATWGARAVAFAIAAAVILAGVRPFADPAQLLIPGLVLLLAAVVLGAPIFAALGGAAVILFWAADSPISTLTLDHYSLVTNPSLPTIPLFTLAGYFLAESGASHRLVGVFQALVGQFRGGPAIVTVLVCAFFTSFTGASGVTILALGGLLMPVLIGAAYKEKDALGLITGAGSLGTLFPPALPMILYAIVASVPMEKMFLGGFFPGILLVSMTAIWGVSRGPVIPAEKKRFDPDTARKALWRAKWELLLPVVAVAALFSGYATPVEAAAATALYAFVVEAFIHREYKGVRDVGRVMVECGLLVGGVLLILGVALGFTNYLVDAEVPATLVEWSTASIRSPLLFLLALNVFLLIVGCLMDVFSAIVVVVPLIVPVGLALGVDPVHLGVIFLANLELGYLTPPVGMNLFLSSYRFGKP
ncbi:MAG TPA: TRAP transporter large permease subunit, partial [Thermoanaerobaculia bacterium]|nr:TRAP transporter large permease subunit [Thermoanaerobaculia bacterium]